MLSQHSSKERKVHGLDGLYPKYRAYVHVISCFSLMIGHGLCFATLQNDPGTPSDLRKLYIISVYIIVINIFGLPNTVVSQLWAVIRDLYSPWVLPYTQQQVSKKLGREPWSSGYGRRLVFQRSCVRIPALFTRWTYFHIYLL